MVDGSTEVDLVLEALKSPAGGAGEVLADGGVARIAVRPLRADLDLRRHVSRSTWVQQLFVRGRSLVRVLADGDEQIPTGLIRNATRGGSEEPEIEELLVARGAVRRGRLRSPCDVRRALCEKLMHARPAHRRAAPCSHGPRNHPCRRRRRRG